MKQLLLICAVVAGGCASTPKVVPNSPEAAIEAAIRYQTIINLYLGLKPSLSNEATQVQNRSEMHHNRNNTEDYHDSLYCMTCISNPSGNYNE